MEVHDLGNITTSLLSYFIHPLLWIVLITTVLVGIIRVRKERKFFNTRLYPATLESARLLLIGLVLGLIVSAITWYTGVIVDFSWLLLFNIVSVVLFATLGYRGLTASYTLALTTLGLIGINLLLLIKPEDSITAVFSTQLIMQPNVLIGLSILLAVGLFIEGFLLYLFSRKPLQPELIKIRRGTIKGQFKFRGAFLLPVFMLFPVAKDGFLSTSEWWPIFSVGKMEFLPLFVPLVIGTRVIVRSQLPKRLLKKRMCAIIALAVIVTLLTVVTFFYNWFTLMPFVMALLGHIGIDIYFWVVDEPDTERYHQTSKGVCVMGTRGNTASRKMGVLPGELITSCNGHPVKNRQELYDALNINRAYVKLTVCDEFNEPRFVETALFETDSFELGLLFIEESVVEEMKDSVES